MSKKTKERPVSAPANPRQNPTHSMTITINQSNAITQGQAAIRAEYQRKLKEGK